MSTLRLPTVAATLLACLLFLPGAAALASEGQLDPDRLLEEGADGTQASDLSWSPGGSRLLYRLPADDGDDRLWIWTAGRDGEEAGDPLPVLAAADLGRAGASLGRVDSVWLPASDGLVLTSDDDLYLLRLEDGGGLSRLTETEAEESDPAPSPDGGRLAFVRDHDLWLYDLDSGEERRLTTGGEEDVTLHGETDWVYWEELWGRDSQGYWWSPGGDRIAYYRFDETPVASYPLVDFTTQYPSVRWQKYPKAGTANPVVRLGVLDLASGETVWLDTGWTATDRAGTDGEAEDPYLARLHWRPDGARVAVQRLNREQNRLDLLLCDPADGSCSTLLTETWPTWVNVENDFAFLESGGFVWGSARSGWRHLYLYDSAGELVRPLTAGEWAVDELAAVDEARGWVVARAYGEGEMGARERRILALPLAGDPADRAVAELAAEPGWNEADVAPKSGLWVHSWSNADSPGQRAVRDAAGSEIVRLPAIAPTVDLDTLPRWKFSSVAGPNGSRLPAMTLEPVGHPGEDEGRHPAIMYHYGGPGSQVVADRWGGSRNLWHKRMALAGFAVLAVDNQASVFFGKRGEDRVHRRFGPTNLAAQLAGVDHLRRFTWIDQARIGLWGWSGGGSSTLYCLLSSPGTWKAGMSGAPVTDWHLYDTIWTERYLDHPDDNAEGYEQSSAVTHAAALADSLLVVHGTGDDNVHPQNTMALSHRLIEAGKPFEQAFYPGEKHGFRGESSRHFYRRMTEFFERELAAE